MTTSPAPHGISAFRKALATDITGDAPWLALQQLVQSVIGARLFTVTAVDLEANLARRLYTNMPDAYPVSGTKPIHVDAWFEEVVIGRRMFVMNTLDHISQHFPDYELIGSLGCASCINMPVVVGGTVLGTVNMLDVENHYTPERVALVEELQLPAITAFLAARPRA